MRTKSPTKMVVFNVNCGKLVEFLKKASAKGTITITKTAKISDDFFKNFYLEAIEDRLEVKAIDSHGSTMWIWHKLSGVEVEEEGKFAVTNPAILLKILSFIKNDREISFIYEEDKPLTIATIGTPFKGFEIREDFTLEAKQIKDYKNNVLSFISVHKFEERPRIEADGKTAEYDTVFVFDSSDLNGIIQQTIEFTKDQDLVMTMSDGSIMFNSGKKNSSKTNDKFEIAIINPIEFTQSFGNLQPIIPHMYKDIHFYLRMASDKKIKMWIQSKSGDIELNFITGAK